MPPVHDYVIDNSTGANVRADINNALAAIVSNNSSSSEPSTKYAYMWWADTTTGILKIRNSANDGWVELLQLDGTLTLEDGSASTPALAFRDDLNTGIYSSAADTINFVTGGVERQMMNTTNTVFNEDGADVDFRIEGDTNPSLFYVDAGNERIGIGTATPVARFEINGGNDAIARITGASTASRLDFATTNHHRFIQLLESGGGFRFYDQTNAAERLRIDSSGNVGIGTTSPQEILHVKAASEAIGNRDGVIFGSTDSLAADKGLPLVWAAHIGTDADYGVASICGRKENATSDNGAGYLQFGTGNDAGAISERMRIDSDGIVQIAAGGAIAGFAGAHIVNSVAPLKIYKSSSTTHAGLQLIWDHFNTSTGISQRIQFTVGDDASSDGFNNAGFIGIEKVDSWQSGSGRSSALIFGNTSAATESEKMRMTSSGQLLVGTASTNGNSAKLIVQADSVPAYYANSGGLNVNVTNSNNIHCSEFFQGRFDKRCITHSHSNTGSVTFDVFEQNDVTVGSITGNASNASFNTSSDYRLKENVVNLTDGITRLKQLIPRRFNWIIDSTNTLEDGFIAHEVQPIIPEAVTGEKDALEEDGSVDPQQMDYSKLTPLLTAALQEAIAKIEVLETKVAALEAA